MCSYRKDCSWDRRNQDREGLCGTDIHLQLAICKAAPGGEMVEVGG